MWMSARPASCRPGVRLLCIPYAGRDRIGSIAGEIFFRERAPRALARDNTAAILCACIQPAGSALRMPTTIRENTRSPLDFAAICNPFMRLFAYIFRSRSEVS